MSQVGGNERKIHSSRGDGKLARGSQFYVKLAFPTPYLQRIDSVPSSSHRLTSSSVAPRNRGTPLGQSAQVLCRLRPLKPINSASEKQLNTEGFNFQPVSYLFILLLGSKMRYRTIHSIDWGGFPCTPRDARSLRSWWQPRGLLLTVGPRRDSQVASSLTPGQGPKRRGTWTIRLTEPLKMQGKPPWASHRKTHMRTELCMHFKEGTGFPG